MNQNFCATIFKAIGFKFYFGQYKWISHCMKIKEKLNRGINVIKMFAWKVKKFFLLRCNCSKKPQPSGIVPEFQTKTFKLKLQITFSHWSFLSVNWWSIGSLLFTTSICIKNPKILNIGLQHLLCIWNFFWSYENKTK